MYGSRQVGVSILVCRPKSAKDIEDIKEHEEALEATAGNMMYDEYRRRRQGTAAAKAEPPETFFELQISVNTFCAFLWTLFGDECDYYKSLMDIRDILLLQEVAYIRTAFTPDICRRITWAIIDDGRAFFNTVMLRGHFDGSIRRVRWPTSNLAVIGEAVRYAYPIQRPNYPYEWRVKTGEGIGGQKGDKGKLIQAGQQGAAGMAPQGAPNKGVAGGGVRQQHRGEWVDTRHPRIAGMMAPYIAAKGTTRINLTEILDAANKRVTDLPQLPIGPGGVLRPVCWGHVLGRCTFGLCRFKQQGGHVERSVITDEFAETVVTMLKPGIQYCVKNIAPARAGGEGGAPQKKLKADREA